MPHRCGRSLTRRAPSVDTHRGRVTARDTDVQAPPAPAKEQTIEEAMNAPPPSQRRECAGAACAHAATR